MPLLAQHATRTLARVRAETDNMEKDGLLNDLVTTIQNKNKERDAYGQAHTTYSLRHSSLCFQILKTGGNDLFGLAKNARTSVLMLEKFYLTHLSPQMPEFTRQLRTRRVLENV